MGCFYMPKGIWEKRYSGEFKQMVIDDMCKNHLGFMETERKYEVDHHTLALWERIYLEEGREALLYERRGRPKTLRELGLTPQKEKNLISENQQLRMENEFLKKLNALVLKEEQQNKKRK